MAKRRRLVLAAQSDVDEDYESQDMPKGGMWAANRPARTWLAGAGFEGSTVIARTMTRGFRNRVSPVFGIPL